LEEIRLKGEGFKSQFGAIAATVGSAVGLGNIWRFPHEMANGGGGAFLLIYIGCILLVCVPLMLAELAIGRHTHMGSTEAIRSLSKKKYTHCATYIGVVASILILSFYSNVAGWILHYIVHSAAGLVKDQPESGSEVFAELTSSLPQVMAYTWTVLVLVGIVMAKGIRKGVERISNVMMPLLFVFLLLLMIRSMMMSGCKDGLHYMFYPSLHAFTPEICIRALGQAFFSLCIGSFGIMTYAAYFRDDANLVHTSWVVAFLDTMVALMAGIIIFSTSLTYGADLKAGPELIFVVMPDLFNQTIGGSFWALLFYILLFFASISSIFTMSEIVISFGEQTLNMSRRTATMTLLGLIMVLSALCAWREPIFSAFDYISSNILMPIGGLFVAIFAGWVLDKSILRNQLATISNRHYQLILFQIKYVAPLAIIILFIVGLLS